ncbi:hypothetical protein G3570_15240 [Balneolaceae bacterium YR4-1]|uniref:Uncharacterized protein n=1 Tax=Halalkalibaculum roseum TaxID=2709311 RepID=A0A6M1TCW1_9BACT|nr:hypothetical protein [Halalkalibaculum roseum]NGP78003.1 hypothetical protein [Halalkalibaculum roseum]
MELSNLIKKVDGLPALYKSDIRAGDHVRIKTRNSTYCLRVLENDTYLVEGGRFDRKKESPLQMSITGCGLGGAFVKTDLVAACGLNIEFENRVITSTVMSFAVFRNEHLN